MAANMPAYQMSEQIGLSVSNKLPSEVSTRRLGAICVEEGGCVYEQKVRGHWTWFDCVAF